MKSIAFFPGHQSDLVHRHMQSHRRRIEQAKARVDTAAPRALLYCTKMREKTTFGHSSDGESSLKLRLRPSAVIEVSVPCDHMAHKTAEGGVRMEHCSTEMSDTSSEKESRSTLGPYFHLLEELECPERDGEIGGRWHLYHTPTGRLTGFLRERQRLNPRKQGHHKWQAPWKPPYTSPVHGQEVGERQHPLNQHAKPLTISYGQSDFTKNKAACLNREKDYSELCGVNVHGTSIVPELATGDILTTNIAGDENSILERHLFNSRRGRDILVEGADMRRKTSVITKSNTRAKQECQDIVLEHRYLEFMSEVTQDILSRSILSKPALDVLCQIHIDQHRHILREDEMKKRLDDLKTRIGLA